MPNLVVNFPVSTDFFTDFIETADDFGFLPDDCNYDIFHPLNLSGEVIRMNLTNFFSVYFSVKDIRFRTPDQMKEYRKRLNAWIVAQDTPPSLPVQQP